jgi:hypothetical protein
MSHLKPKLAMIIGGVALFALIGMSTAAEAARKKPVARSGVSHGQTQPNPARSSYGFQPRAFSPQPSGSYVRPVPGTGILHGGPAAGWGGPP